MLEHRCRTRTSHAACPRRVTKPAQVSGGIPGGAQAACSCRQQLLLSGDEGWESGSSLRDSPDSSRAWGQLGAQQSEGKKEQLSFKRHGHFVHLNASAEVTKAQLDEQAVSKHCDSPRRAPLPDSALKDPSRASWERLLGDTSVFVAAAGELPKCQNTFAQGILALLLWEAHTAAGALWRIFSSLRVIASSLFC